MVGEPELGTRGHGEDWQGGWPGPEGWVTCLRAEGKLEQQPAPPHPGVCSPPSAQRSRQQGGESPSGSPATSPPDPAPVPAPPASLNPRGTPPPGTDPCRPRAPPCMEGAVVGEASSQPTHLLLLLQALICQERWREGGWSAPGSGPLPHRSPRELADPQNHDSITPTPPPAPAADQLPDPQGHGHWASGSPRPSTCPPPGWRPLNPGGRPGPGPHPGAW